jgi:tetratricopeptide (TPR) repeat protein
MEPTTIPSTPWPGRPGTIRRLSPALLATLVLTMLPKAAPALAQTSTSGATGNAVATERDDSDDLFAPVDARIRDLEARAPAPNRSPLTPEDIDVLVALGRIDEAAARLDRVTGDPRAVAVVRGRVALIRQDYDVVRSIVPDIAARTDRNDDETDLLYRWLFITDDAPEVDRRTRALPVTPGSSAPVPDLLAAGRLAHNMLAFDRAESCYARARDRAEQLLASSAPAPILATARAWQGAALRGLGLVQYRRRDYDGAFALQRQSLAADAVPDGLMGLAETLIRLGRTDDAITAIERAVRMNPYHESAHYFLGNGYARKNYTELAAAYPEAFLDETGRAAVESAESLLAAGDRAGARAALEGLRRTHAGRADLLVRLASLDFEDGRYAEARDLCFAALWICPEFGRAHATLAKSLEFLRFGVDVHRTDYEARFAAQTMPDLPGIDRYVINWSSLSPRHQKRVALSVAPWKNFLPVLLEGGCTHYIKPLHELLSESPGLETLRDQRINYDSRLWDDVRGAGGYNTVTGIEDVERTIFDRYNTVLHELTHQVHGVMTADQNRQIQEHYRKAKERDDVTKKGFLSRYAGGSVYEYYAEGANALVSRRRDIYDTREEVYERLETIDPDLMALVRGHFALTNVEPNYAIAYVNAGQDRLYKGDAPAAIAFYEKALARTPDEETALQSLVFARTAQGDREGALRDAARMKALYPTSGSVQTTAGDALWRGGTPLAAVIDQVGAARGRVKVEDRYLVDLALGGWLWNQGRAEEAIATYDSVLAYQSDSPDALWGKASSLALAGRWEEAFPLYEQAVRLRTGVVSLRCDVARDLIRAGRVDEARKHLDEARILEAENPVAEALRGWAALASGDAAAALAHARQATSWGEWCDLARIVAAKAHQALGDRAAAGAAVAPVRERLVSNAPPAYLYLPKQATWQSIHELPAIERALLAELERS